jgi:hypothetical protein
MSEENNNKSCKLKDHLKNMNETYFEHLKRNIKVIFELLIIILILFIHMIFPSIHLGNLYDISLSDQLVKISETINECLKIN